MPGDEKPMDHFEELKGHGFKRIGTWLYDRQEGSIRLCTDMEVSREPGVYAFVVDGEVCYVGKGQSGLYRRIRRYTNPKGYRTSRPVFEGLLRALKAGSVVDVYVLAPIEPKEVKGLPVDWASGLEGGLIRDWKPEWNQYGKAEKRDG